MSATAIVRRVVGGGLVTAVAGVALALAPGSAHAAIVPDGPRNLPSGSSFCVGSHADSDAKGTGTADNPGVVYIMSRNGTEIWRTPTRRTGLVESPVFAGTGFYQWCAKNATGLGVTVNNVSITLYTDGDA